jgi:hypothetical protein
MTDPTTIDLDVILAARGLTPTQLQARVDAAAAAQALAEAAAASAGSDATYAKTRMVTDTINTALSYAWTDEYGFARTKIDQSGNITANGITAASADLGSIALSNVSIAPNAAGVLTAWVDDYGFATTTISPSGVKSTGIQAPTAATYVKGNWNYERTLFAIYGQSVAIGMKALPALTTAQLYGSTMLSTGMRTEGVNVSAATLVPAIEVDDNTNLVGETPVSGAMAFINQLIASENGLPYTAHSFEMTGFAPGKSSQPISALVKGTSPYTQAMAVIDRIVALSPNTPVGMLALGWVQGESDAQAGTAFETYITALRGLRADWDADVKTRTGQTEDVHLLSYQTSSHIYYGQAAPTIALAQLEASVRDPLIHCVCPIYQMDYADNIHLTDASEKWLGAYIGLVYWWVVIMGRAWKPLTAKRKIVRGTAIDLIFDVPKPPLVLDTAWVSNPGNYGFQLVDSGGSALTISSVTLIGPDRVRIVAAAAVPAGAKVRYAWGALGGSTFSGRLTGPRGNLRDSAGNNLICDPTGIARPMHNWSLFFEI